MDNSVCLNVCMYTMYMSGVHKKVMDPLELDLLIIGSYHMSAGNQTEVLCTSSKCS